jgi:preprotein translocase subunit SecE
MAKDIRLKDKNDDMVDQSPSISVRTVKTFSIEVQNEFNKIAWPDKKHTVASTGIVVVLVMIISVYLASVDLVVGKLIGVVLN